jgi:hypothetical protein
LFILGFGSVANQILFRLIAIRNFNLSKICLQFIFVTATEMVRMMVGGSFYKYNNRPPLLHNFFYLILDLLNFDLSSICSLFFLTATEMVRIMMAGL